MNHNYIGVNWCFILTFVLVFPVADRLYWSVGNQLMSSYLSGSNQEVIAIAKLYIECVLVANPYIYYSSNENQ